jgi:Erv1 / Alr family
MSNACLLSKHDWGTIFWSYIHTITVIDGKEGIRERSERAKEILSGMGFLVFCKTCRNEYEDMLKKYPLDNVDLDKPMALFAWTVKIHNEVNKKLNKPEFTVEQATHIWSIHRSREKSININSKEQIHEEFVRNEIYNNCGPIDVNIVRLSHLF